jgi:light-regulated signal transduction histidine kinase (bacteriophytochrome)
MTKKNNEFLLSNKELFIESDQDKLAAKLLLANKELFFQNEEKEKRAAELILANIELAFQNEEKEKRAAELLIANKELIYENSEKEKRASELIIANKELTFQNEEKIKRAAELIIANRKLILANNELIAFTYISSHDLQEPLRKIQTFISLLLEKEEQNLSVTGKDYFKRIQSAAGRMRQLISDLLDFSRINSAERKLKSVSLHQIIEEVKEELVEIIEEKKAVIEINQDVYVTVIAFQFRQLFYNLLENALKFSRTDIPPLIFIESKIIKGDSIPFENILPGKDYFHVMIKDNGIGFEPEFAARIFEVFQKLHSKEEYDGTGIGLAIVRKIVDNHYGIINATSELGKGSTFNVYIPISSPL